MRPINQKMYEDLLNLNFPQNRILKLSNGIDSKRFMRLAKNKHEETNFGFVGRLTKIKNLKFLLEVFIKYFSQYSKDKLLIFGEGPEEKPILDFNKFNRMDNNIFLNGFEKDKEKIYANLDVIINTSYGEGISNVILEAMATKTFVIASNVQGNNDLIKHGETGLLYNINNKKNLLDQLIYYKKNQNLIDQILKNAEKQVIQNYDIEVIADKLYSFLKTKLFRF